ncbi:hypothetical protein BGZ93_002415 [Podila epicladia]|nr:hypothetical protein BGZ93_002415 [Podila epicladia]KAG0091622.1 hypothetical protein BGZ92_000214 [Podila epicladia]
MAPPKPPPFKPHKPPTFQTFESVDGKPLPQTIGYAGLKRNRKYILWKDVQRVFPGIDYLKSTFGFKSRAPYMVDQDGKLLQPLCIKPDFIHPYQVVYRHYQGYQRPELDFEYLYHTWVAAFKDLEQQRLASGFQEMAANVRYHYSKLLDQLAVLKEIGVQAEADGKTEGHILSEFEECRQKMASWDYTDSCFNVLRENSDYPVPCQFMVLPSDLGSWDDSDPATHNFRLHFLCDTQLEKHVKSALPEHKHLLNHPGYDLIRPQEFFQKYGSYALIILKMVRQGFSTPYYEISPLETFKILWGCVLDDSSNLPTKETIEPLVNKAIGYLEGLSPPRRSQTKPTERECVAIKDFLAVPDSSNTLGGLYRYTDEFNHWYWYCKQHAHQWLTPGTLEMLVDFVHNCGGQVDMQRATLHIELHSRSQTDQFYILLNDIKPKFHDISIMLGWKDASRQDLVNILQKVVDTASVQHLELSGVSYDTYLQGTVDYRHDIFASLILKSTVLKTVTLLHCPRPQEQYTYFGTGYSVVRLHFEQQEQVEIKHSWNDLRIKTGEIAQTYEILEFLEASQRLQDFLALDGYQPVSTIGHHQSNWRGEFILEKGTLQELQVYNLSAFDVLSNTVWVKPVVPEALESLHALTVDVDDLDIDQVVTRVVQASPQLRDLLISLQENHALERVEKTYEMWQGRSSSLQLTLLERDSSGRGHVVAQALIRGHIGCLGSDRTDLHGRNVHSTGSHDWKQGRSAKAEFLQWNCDHVSAPLVDSTVDLLDMATEQHLSVLTSFVLDISNLSQEFLSHVQNILQRSILSHLQICCTAFNASRPDFVCRVLLAVQWSTLQSLVLSGAAVNEWIPFLATATGISLLDLQLQCFRVQGTGKQSVYLTHSSVLFIHQLKYSNPLMKVALESVCLQDDRDSDLILESPLLSE